jgi:hypothetical protein
VYADRRHDVYGDLPQRRWLEAIAERFVYFNHDRGGAAVRDADALTPLIADRGGRGIELARTG